MPSVRVYDRIPRTSYEADAMLREAGRDALTLGHQTVLSRRSRPAWYRGGEEVRWIALAYHGSDIVEYQADGAIRIDCHGYYTRTTINRIRRALPPLWAIEFSERGPRRRRMLVYREGYRFSLDDGWFTFRADGGLASDYYNLTAEELDRYVAEAADMAADIARERGGRAQRARVAAERRRARGRQAPPPRPEEPEDDEEWYPCEDPGCVVCGLAPAPTPAVVPTYERCDVGACADAGHAEHYGHPCRTDPFCLCSATCLCERGDSPYTDPQAIHGRYACFPHPSAEEMQASWERAQAWLQPAIERYRMRLMPEEV